MIYVRTYVRELRCCSSAWCGEATAVDILITPSSHVLRGGIGVYCFRGWYNAIKEDVIY